MEKEAYYFPHFSNARHDRKIQRLRKELGIEGYGIFFMLLETLRDQIDLKYPMSDIDLLADEFGTSEQKIRTVIANYQLFELDESELFFSPRMLVYLQPYFSMKEQRKIAGRASAEARRNKHLELPFNDRSTGDEQKKGKESKVNESKVKDCHDSSANNHRTIHFDSTTPEYKLATEMLNSIKLTGTSMKDPDLNKWSESFDRIHRIDKRAYDWIMELMDKVYADNFWKNQIRSPDKLREQINTGKLDKFIITIKTWLPDEKVLENIKNA